MRTFGSLHRLQQIFDLAVEVSDPDQRASLLRSACGGDDRLLQEVQELLEHDGLDLTRGMAFPLHESKVDTSIIHEGPGSAIGNYKLRELIGEGGFGMIYRADQLQPVRRPVAIKIIKPGMDSREVLARFESERQALAMMDHPHIAQVLDAGISSMGRPYFVMELVRGLPITRFCDESKLDVRDRLKVFVTVCRAIQHAHQKGVIHRDIKPGNVLVGMQDGEPLAKVIDFGVAKALHQPLTAHTIYTQFSQIIGTPAYMSPEQAGFGILDIDTRSDIYSLGVLMYELLTGTTPHDGKRLAEAGYDKMREILREEEPPPPSTRLAKTTGTRNAAATTRQADPVKLSRLIKGELDWIVMKCLAKDRNRRYETANGLAQDVERYLRGEPVLAGPPSNWYRFRKFIGRYRAAASVAALVGLILLASVMGITWTMFRALNAERATHEALVDVSRERDAKEEALRSEAEQKLMESQQRERAENSERLAIYQLWHSHLQTAESRVAGGQIGQRWASLDAIRDALALLDEHPDLNVDLGPMRAVACAASILPDIHADIVWREPDMGSVNVMCDQGLNWYTLPHDRSISVRKTGTGDTCFRVDLADAPQWHILGDDGTLLLVGGPRSTSLWQLDHPDTGPLQMWEITGQGWGEFLPGEETIIVGVPEGTALVDAKNGNIIRQIWNQASWTRPVISSDGRYAALTSRSLVAVVELATGVEVLRKSLDAVLFGSSPVAWCPDTDLLALWPIDGNVVLVDVSDDTVLAQWPRTGGDMVLSFDATGQLLLSVTRWDATLRIWDVSGTRLLLSDPASNIAHVSPRSQGGWRLFEVNNSNREMSLKTISGLEGLQPFLVEPGHSPPYQSLDFSPDQRWLAAGTANGLELFDVHSLRLVQMAPIGSCFAQFAKSGDLFVSVGGALYCFPLHRPDFEPDQTEADATIQWGPPRQILPAPYASGRFSLSGNPPTIVTHGHNGAWVLHPDVDASPHFLGTHDDVRFVASSPDGRYVATGSWYDGAKVWDVKSAAMLHHFPVGSQCNVAISASGEWFITAAGQIDIWEIGTWRHHGTVLRQDASRPFISGVSPFADYVAVTSTGLPNRVYVIDLMKAQLAATYPGASGMRFHSCAAMADGTRIAVSPCNGEGPLQIWDIARLQELVSGVSPVLQHETGRPRLQADRNTADSADRKVVPRLILGETFEAIVAEALVGQALNHARRGRHDRARAARQRALEFDLQLALSCNNLAWSLLTAHPKDRDPQRALTLARQAIALEPDNANYLNTLGVALYQSGQYREAEEVLLHCIEIASDGSDAFDRYYLAMCYARTGRLAEARDQWKQATDVWERYRAVMPQDWNEDLVEFAREAELEISAASAENMPDLSDQTDRTNPTDLSDHD